MKIVFAAIFVLVIATATAFGQLRSFYLEAAREACEIFEQNYYRREQSAAQNFYVWCLKDAAKQEFLIGKTANIRRINDRLSAMRVSHLAVYNPDENRMIWENQGFDTGIRSRMVEDQLVVYRVLPESPAGRQGVRPGDALVSLNGEMLAGGWSAQTGSGVFQIRRMPGEEIWLEIRPEEIAEDLAPTLKPVGRGLGLLTVPSFLAQYFEAASWKELSTKLSSYKGVIVDLRDNPGGSFPAMLRVLSSFLCRETNIGSIYHSPRRRLSEHTVLRDDLDAESQVKQLAEAASVELRTFANYGCYQGPVRVLVDSGTSSVAEIFAQAITKRARARVFGQPTAGQVVMARWFSLASLGSSTYSMSVPIAGYRTADGEELEESGVQPAKYLYYDLPVSLAGRDSWLEEVTVSF